jgi:hypothetical protein
MPVITYSNVKKASVKATAQNSNIISKSYDQVSTDINKAGQIDARLNYQSNSDLLVGVSDYQSDKYNYDSKATTTNTILYKSGSDKHQSYLYPKGAGLDSGYFDEPTTTMIPTTPIITTTASVTKSSNTGIIIISGVFVLLLIIIILFILIKKNIL